MSVDFSDVRASKLDAELDAIAAELGIVHEADYLWKRGNLDALLTRIRDLKGSRKQALIDAQAAIANSERISSALERLRKMIEEA